MSICLLVTSCIIPQVTACFQNLRFCNFGECFLKCDCIIIKICKKKINKPNTQLSKLPSIVRRNYIWNHVFYSTNYIGELDSGCLWRKASKNLRIHSRNIGILLISICILLTSNIIPPITACFQSLRSCSFSKCFLTGNWDYKHLIVIVKAKLVPVNVIKKLFDRSVYKKKDNLSQSFYRRPNKVKEKPKSITCTSLVKLCL